jgi:hypothetical protein
MLFGGHAFITLNNKLGTLQIRSLMALGSKFLIICTHFFNEKNVTFHFLENCDTNAM